MTATVSLSGVGIEPRGEGGRIAVAPGRPAEAPGLVGQTQAGVAFGPLEFQTRRGATAGIADLEYRAAQQSWFGSLLDSIPNPLASVGTVAAAGAAAHHEERSVSRRDVLALGVAAAGISATTEPAAAASEMRDVLEGELVANPAGLRLRVHDAIAGYLPTDAEYEVRVGDTIWDTFRPRSEAALIPPSVTGDLAVATDADVPIWESLSGIFGSEPAVFDLKLPASPAAKAAGTTLPISSEPTVVEPARSTPADEMVFEIEGVSIAHAREGDDSAGSYRVTRPDQDPPDTLVYTVGEDSPIGTNATLKLNVSMITEFTDDAERRVPL